MNTSTIKCPQCNTEISLDDVLTHDIEEKVREDLEKKIKNRIENEKNLELEDIKKELQEKKNKINEYQEKELELREKTRKLEERENELRLEVERKIDTERKRVEEEAYKKYSEEHYLKDKEKDTQIEDMKRLIEDLKRRSQQGSMQTQGEVAEIELEETLRKLFPYDEITEVKKGELGGDVRQIIKTQLGNVCGLIIWERKRTKAWDEKWVSKLKEDMARDKAHIGVVVSDALPKDFKKSMGERNGIWVTTSEFVEILATLLRKNLYDVAKEKAVVLNKQSKAEEIYDYITSHDFVSQIERMYELYKEINDQITKERAVMERQWEARERQVKTLMRGVSGIYGNMQGIAGTAMPIVKSLSLESGETV